MKQAIHHVSLNEKLEDCFGILDQIQKTYRNYNTEYVKIVQAHPTTMNTFFDSFEAAVCKQFKIHPAVQQEEIEEMLRKETEEKQAKLEEEALAEYEKKQKEEEAKAAAEAAKDPKAKAPAKAAPKKGGKEEKPQLDVPKLEVPQVTPFKSEMGNEYVRERTTDEIATKLMEMPKEEEDVTEEKAEENQQEAAAQETPAKAPEPVKAPEPAKAAEPAAAGEQVEEVEDEEKPPEEPPFKPNDYLQKAEMEPPHDPQGNKTMHADLIIQKSRIMEIL